VDVLARFEARRFEDLKLDIGCAPTCFANICKKIYPRIHLVKV